MRRGGRGYNLQVPWRQHDDPVPSSTPFEQLEGRKFRLVIALVGFTTAVLIFVWNSKRVVSRSDLPPRTSPGLVFPLYSHNYIQSPNGSQDETWHQGSGANGRRRRTLSHPLFKLKPEDRLGRVTLYIEMKLGIQAKLFNFDIDTGSGSTWVYCKLPGRKANVERLGPHGYFKPKNVEPMKCNGKDKKLCHKYQGHYGEEIPCNARHNFECSTRLSYIDGTQYKGTYIRESFTLPTWDKMEVTGQGVLGCINKQKEVTGRFFHIPKVTDGIIGMGCKSTIISEWIKSKVINKRRIGICIRQAKSRQLLSSRIDVGYATVGVNLHEKFGANHFGWVALANTEGFDCALTAPLNYITFGGKTYYPPTTSVSPSDLVIDTGGPLTKLDEWFYDKLFDDKQLNSHVMEKGYTTTSSDRRHEKKRACWTAPKDTTTSPVDNFPILTFCMGLPNPKQLDPIQCLVVQPRNYLEWKEDELLLCLNILKQIRIYEDDYSSSEEYLKAKDEEPLGESILAVAQMRGLLIEVDLDNYRIRWKPDLCDF